MNKKTLNVVLSSLVLGSSFLTGCSVSTGTTTTTPLKDGTYKFKQTYSYAEGKNSFIEVEVELKDSKINNINVIGDPDSKFTTKYAEDFGKNIKSKLIGKTIEEGIKSSFVSGASFTSAAFGNALNNIKGQASK